jgi:hypothetical protein
MPPMLAQVRIITADGHRIRLWLPLFLLWILLIPLLILLSPVIVIGLLIARFNPFEVIWGLLRVIAALAGTQVEVKAPDADILVRVG